ncbi:hypothetical protein [Nostoc sp. WHI]|uniref:hypothetical protein n=1 Tax=Nostoc sp. WHI TaxID=2650611 RepID=UPI0018C74E11|nr:hypothetical protein [Nostoc sp. WHI]MBG1270860.1 hypothetical protein [Nostoc sp. WHI]
MNNNEYKNLYDQLKKILKEYNLTWVVEQVNETIREGKIVNVEESFPRKSKTKTHRIKKENFSEKEKLFLLIDAFERIILDSSEIENELNEFLTEENRESILDPKLLFSEEDDEDYQVIFYTDSVKVRQQIAMELKNLLDMLRKEVNK